jgi:DNA invertase Pin-like site-specific DNA recombinase
MRVALYARYSSDLQNERSADDQLAALRTACAARGWTVAAEFADRGISGAAVATRPGVQALMRAAAAGDVDVVLTEALDRLSRSQSDIARLFELLAFSGVQIQTLSGGPVTELHIGLEGTMNRLFLVELGKKTRRGLEGRVRAGFSAGGRCYGYRIAGKGELAIDEREAEVVRRIFRDYAAGQSAIRIAKALNRDGVPGPRGGTWAPNSISGDRRAGDGILCQELYIGVRVFNRRRFRKHPETGRRSGVLNPPEAWIREPVPQLRILDDAAWAAVQDRQCAITADPGRHARAPKRLLSGLLKCGLCEGSMTLQGGIYRCSNHKDRGAAVCTNGKQIKAATVEARVLQGVKRYMLNPQAIAEAVREIHAGQAVERRRILADRAPLERELSEIARRLDRAQQAYLAGAMDVGDLAAVSDPLKARRREIEARLAEAADDAGPAPVIQLHPGAARAYQMLAEQLEDAMGADDGQEARDELRKLIDRVVFTPREGLGRFDLQVHGRLDDLLKISTGQATDAKNPRALRLGGIDGCGSPIRDIPLSFAA